MGGATVVLNECTFLRNVLTGVDDNTAIISVNAVDPTFPGGIQQDTIVRLQRITMAENTGPNGLVAHSQGLVFSQFDVVSLVIRR